MAESISGSYQPASTYIDSSKAVTEANEANGVSDTDGERSAAAELNFDTFLQLLTVQLQYQDPLNPMEDTEWTTQLAQYSTLEAQLESNELLERIANNETYNLESLAISYIGKDALIPGTLTASDGNTPTSINYSLQDQAYQAVIEIREVVQRQNEDGSISEVAGDVVRTLEGTTYTGRNEVAWDGLDDEGNPVDAGYYFFDVSAVDTEGNGIVAREYTYGHVVAAETTEDGDVQMTLGDGRMVLLDDILLVRESALSASSSTTDTTTGDGDTADTADSGSENNNNEEEQV